MFITVIRHCLYRSINVEASTKLHLLFSSQLRPLRHISKVNFSITGIHRKTAVKFGKKVKQKILAKVSNMDDPKILEALAPIQASVKEQVF